MPSMTNVGAESPEKYPSKPKNKDRTQMRSNPQEYSLQRNKRGAMLVTKGTKARPGFQVVFTGSYDDCDKAVLAEMARHEQAKRNPWDSQRKDQILKDRNLKRADLSTAGRADLLLLIQESGSGPAAKAAQAEIDRRAAKKAAKRGGPAKKGARAKTNSQTRDWPIISGAKPSYTGKSVKYTWSMPWDDVSIVAEHEKAISAAQFKKMRQQYGSGLYVPDWIDEHKGQPEHWEISNEDGHIGVALSPAEAVSIIKKAKGR